MNDEFIKAEIYYERSWPIEKDGEKYYIDADKTQEIINFFRRGNTKLKTYCVTCKDDESFTSNSNLTFPTDAFGNRSIRYGDYRLFDTYLDERIYLNPNLIGKSFVKTELLNCNLNDEHQYVIFYTVTYGKNKFSVKKIGQNVSPYEIGLPQVKTYEKQLSRFDAVEDYRRVFIHKINNDSVAALLYLRRVFEKIVIKLLDGATLSDNRFETKIIKLKDENKLNPDVNELTKLVYELLSKGIHQLSNEECSTLYNSLYLFIEMQLIYIKTEEEKSQKLVKLKKELNDNHGKYK